MSGWSASRAVWEAEGGGSGWKEDNAPAWDINDSGMFLAP